MINVEIWSDYVCPFCYIGKKELEHAVEELGLQNQMNIIHRAYLLDPNTPVDSKDNIKSSIQRKYGMSPDQVKEMCDSITARAATVGLAYNFDTMKVANTMHAHKLVKWASEFNKEKELNERLLKAYFTEGEAIGQIDVLEKLVAEVGLDSSLVKTQINNPTYLSQVEEDILKAQQMGARGVPLFLFNSSVAISGAQPKEAFKEVLTKIALDNGLTIGNKNTDTTPNVCGVDGCY